MMPPKSYREALLGKPSEAHFKIPSKERNIIPIVAPGDDDRQQPKSTPKQSAKSSTSTQIPASSSNQIITQGSQHSSTSEPTSNGLPHQNTVKTNDPPASISFEAAPNSFTTIQSSLNIFSENYVPAWLRAVNSSSTDYYPCSDFPTIDFSAYIATLVGADFVRNVSPCLVPPLTPIPSRNFDVQPHIYGSYWIIRLQNEFALQKEQVETFALYNHDLRECDGRPGYKRLHVPGLRENAPRVDLGDKVHVRILYLASMSMELTYEGWYHHGYPQGVPCPGFGRILYNPRVWEIDRVKEEVVILIDGAVPGNLKCNVQFLVQEPKLEPVFRAVHEASQLNLWLYRVLFPESKDGVMQSTLSQAHFDIEWFDELNWEQKKAVHSVVSTNYGTVPYLISGPPGTGKTKTLVETALQLIQRPGHVLICAPSDAAADILALRLSLHLKPDDLFRLHSWTRTFAEVPDRLLLYTYSCETSFTLPPVEQMLSFRIVVTTCRDADLLNCARLTNTALSGLFNNVQRILNPDILQPSLHWTALLLDEAAQAMEPDVLIPLNVVKPLKDDDFPQFVAAGDQYQLGPKLLSNSNLNKSLFQRLFERPLYSDHPLSRQNGTKSITSAMLPMLRPPFTNLIRNYRSHPAILSVPSSLFYADTLIPERKTSTEVLTWSVWPSSEKWPVLFHQNDSEDRYESVLHGDGTGAGALYNPGEAAVALALATSLLRHVGKSGNSRINPKEIMIMSPYRSQVSYLRKLFRQNNLFEVNIGPLDAFQGLESRVVIICTTRTRLGKDKHVPMQHILVDKSRALGLIDEPQRLNVALTRAQEGLIVIGNAQCLISTRDHSWLNFLDFCKRNNCYRVPPNYEWPDLGGPYPQGRLERALIYAATYKAEIEGKSQNSVNNTPTKKSSFKLKGPRQDMDEEMWQFKELAQLHDSEYVDLVLEHTLDMENGDHISDEETELNLDGVYDRDLRQEFYKDCVTQ